MRPLLLSLLLALALPAAAQQRPAPKATVATHYQRPGADCALFPAAADMGSWHNEESLPRTGRFTPTRPQVATVEALLPSAELEKFYDPRRSSIKGYYSSYPAAIKKALPKYQRQYFGFYNLQHQPCLYINFFIEEVEYAPGTVPGWLRYPIQVHDGGAAFWQIYYNLTTHQFYNFSHGLEG